MTDNHQITPHNPLEGEKPELNINLHDGSEEQVSIIIVHKDRPEYLNICLQSIAVCSTNNNYEIIVVDNHSGQDSQEFLSEIAGDVKVVRNEKNLYWSGACNKGVEVADKNSKYFIFLHCDVAIINKAWIDLLINVSEAQGTGMVGVNLSSYLMQNQKVDFIEEYCLLLSRECWEDVGPWPEAVPLVGASFIFTVKAQTGGFKPQIMKNPICHHYKIFSVDINEYEKLTEQAMASIPRLLREVQTQTVPVIAR